MSESLGGEWMVGDNGDSCGLVHINKNYYPDEFKKCYDNDFSLRFAANLIKEEREYLFTSCNCYQFAKYVSGYKLPLMKDIQPNTYAFEGALVIFDYDGVKHLAYIEKFNETTMTVREANYIKCSNANRDVDYNDPAIKGFWSPPESH